MRLERLTLAPYGLFADHALTFSSDAALHIVLGPNESGKTTTLSAIGDLLFGFPARTSYDFTHAQQALRVGGRFRLADGSALELRRRKGNKNTLVDAADQPLSDEKLQHLLGAIDRKTFETEFGLTAQALRDGGETLLRAGGGLAETLAASSAGLGALTRARDRLSGEADELFTPRRAASKMFYVALERHDDAERRLRDCVITADALKAAEAAVLGAKARENDLNSRYKETDRALARWRRAQRTAGKLARLDALSHEARAFGNPPTVGADRLREARDALAEDNSIRVEWERLAAEDAEDQAEIDNITVDSALLAKAEPIDALQQQLGAVRKARDDLPRRVESHNAARGQLDELARRLGLPDHAALLAAPPTDVEITRARAKIAARRRGEEKYAEAMLARERSLAERDGLRDLSRADAVDPEPLKRRLAGMADVAADADRLRRERAASDAEARALADEAARLDPQAGEIDALARLALPDETAISAHLRADEELSRARAALVTSLIAARRAVEAGEAALAKREAGGPGATRADWMAARERRETGFVTLGAILDDDSAARRERFEALRSLTLAADVIAEAALTDSDRAARLSAERESLAAKREDLKRIEAEIGECEAKRGQASAEWRAMWAPSGLTPLARPSMARWRERVAGLLIRRAELNKRRAEIDALAPRLEDARASLAAWLAEFGAKPAAHESFDETLRAARLRLDALQMEWARSREIEMARRRAEKDAIDAEAAVVRETAAQAARAAEWPAAMAGIRLTGAAGPEEAEAALTIWEAIALPRQTMAREARSIEGIESDIGAFEAGVAGALLAAPALAASNAPETLNSLMAGLSEARRARDSRASLQRAVASRAVKRGRLEARRAALGATLASAAEALAVPDLAALEATLDRMEQRQALESERATLRRDLSEIADGLDEAALRAEQSEFEIALAPGNIELARQQQEALLQEIRDAAGIRREAEARLEALAEGRDAAGAARDRQEAAGELLDIAERWIVRQAAARLATRAIERHRAAVQDPMLSRAGELFAKATAGGFSGLATAYDASDRPALVARRRDGGSVPIEGLSEGARDQLFLSLRLALLERRAGEPLPFIGDDILASFDDERTRRALGLLVEYGARRQVIVFTHHRHVAELALQVEGAAIDVLEM